MEKHAHDGGPPDPRTAGPRPPFPQQKLDVDRPEEAELRPRPDFGEESYRGLGRLRDRVALVTGADSGIGRAVALAFAREGADVAIGYWRSHGDAAETRRVVEAAGRRAIVVASDLAEEAGCRQLVDETVAAFGRIDVLVNNAAYQREDVERFEDIDPQVLERTFRTNIVAMFHLVRLALPYMRSGATIINTASIQAYNPSPGILDYATTKGAIVTFTKGLAQSLIERGIRVNCVAPGPVWTPLPAASYPPDKVAQFGKQSPMGRPAQPAELAPAYVFLACDESRYVVGEILGVTGGRPLG
jgi:NAD(P)-dependent dehydrogenase (short-subunit alcohol dehydrogenase family)